MHVSKSRFDDAAMICLPVNTSNEDDKPGESNGKAENLKLSIRTRTARGSGHSDFLRVWSACYLLFFRSHRRCWVRSNLLSKGLSVAQPPVELGNERSSYCHGDGLKGDSNNNDMVTGVGHVGMRMTTGSSNTTTDCLQDDAPKIPANEEPGVPHGL